MTAPAVDRAEADRFLTLLAEHEPVTFQTFDDLHKRRVLARILHGDLDEHVDVLERLNTEGAGIFAMVNRGNGNGRDTQSVTAVRAVFVDLDGAPLEPVWQCSLEPHLVVESSPNRYHAYWLVDDLDVAQFTSVQRSIAQRFSGDPAVHDLPRVMRLPGFVHRKHEPFQSRISHENATLPYSAAEIFKAFPPPQSEHRRPDLGIDHDPALKALAEKSLIQSRAHPGKWVITCPWSAEHSNGDATGTIYFEAHTNGYTSANWKCHHAHCADRTIEHLRVWLGLSEGAGATSNLLLDTDLANAARLAARHGADLRYTPERGWLVWDGCRWCVDNNGRVMSLAKSTVREIFNELAQLKDAEQKALFTWARRSQAADRLKAMVFLAESEPSIPARLADFNADPLLLNCANGTVCLRTGELREHTRGDYISRLVDIAYLPDAACPLWLGFLDRVMAGDADMIQFLQCAVGYSLTGSISEQCLFFLYGTGANGKSIFLEALKLITGDYGLAASAQTLMASRQSSIPNDIARLAGSRFVACGEIEDGTRLRESLVKDLTGGDTITARFMRREFFDFVPQCKLWIRGNHKPQIRGTDEGIWRRIHLVPFAVQIPPAQRDPDLLDKLRAELSGILAWAVRGCIEHQRYGLATPAQVKDATAEYRTEMDVIGEFLFERCVDDAASVCSARDLYQAYRAWCEDNGTRPLSQTRFGSSLRERGYVKSHAKRGTHYQGVRLRG